MRIFSALTIASALLLLVEIEGVTRKCKAKSPKRIIHLCLGDTALCEDPTDIFGGWTVTKKDYCNGQLTQPDREVALEHKNLWGLPCRYQECKFDFTCKKNLSEDRNYRQNLPDNLCIKEARTSNDPDIRQRAKERIRVTSINVQRCKRDKVPSKWDLNYFVQAYKLMYNQSVVCYPSLSLRDLFTPTPVADPTERLVRNDTERPKKNITKDVTFGIMATCMNGTGGNANASYPSCWNSTGQGCALVWAPTKLTCVGTRERWECNRNSDLGEINCHSHQQCTDFTVEGPQWVCGKGNGTHLEVNGQQLGIVPLFGPTGNQLSNMEAWVRIPLLTPNDRFDLKPGG